MPAEHGTRAAYISLRCRCPRCTAANTAYQRGYRRHMRGAELADYTARNADPTVKRRGRITWHEPALF